MRQYIICYDLYRPGQNYSELTAEIKRLGEDWDHPLSNLWIIETDLGADDIRARLSDHLVPGDKLYVRQAGDDLAGLDIAPGSPRSMRAVSSAARAPVKILARVLPHGELPREHRLLTAATAESL
jgi:hypothetical protein